MTSPSPTVVRQYLERGLNRMERNGWFRMGPYGASGGRECVVLAVLREIPGAISLEPAPEIRSLADSCLAALRVAAGIDAPDDEATCMLIRWNDDPSRTFSDVKAAYLKAIEARK